MNCINNSSDALKKREKHPFSTEILFLFKFITPSPICFPVRNLYKNLRSELNISGMQTQTHQLIVKGMAPILQRSRIFYTLAPMQSQLLNFKDQNLTEFPASLRENTQVSNLNLDNNKISSIPEWVSELTNLKVLYLNSNQIDNIEALTTLSSLEVLHLNQNRLHSIPDNIGTLTNLKSLFVYDNYLTSLPDTICNLFQLRKLLAAQNGITDIPSGIGQLKQLEVLNLFDNKITSIPESIGELSSLDYLQLGKNKISQLPENIGSLQTVNTFRIFSNKLNNLPPQFKQLKNLKHLNIADNNLTHIENIPASVRELSIYANPVDYIDTSILNRFKESYKDTFDYLFIDNQQAGALKFEKDQFGPQLKITDLVAQKIHWRDEKNMPPELIKKWELQRTKEDF